MKPECRPNDALHKNVNQCTFYSDYGSGLECLLEGCSGKPIQVIIDLIAGDSRGSLALTVD
jgi:hypothetical protein